MLFPTIIYGPVHSRRLGLSLGINLMPTAAKLCTFNCIYCECGWNRPVDHPVLPTRGEVKEALEKAIAGQTEMPDVLTFSGNGEPTLHPDFEGIIQDTCLLRDRYCPDAKVSVLSNSTQLYRPDVVRGLKAADNRILKLDSAIDSTMHLIDQPVNKELTVAQLKEYFRAFDHDFTLQTCFLQGIFNGQTVDNTTPEETKAWLRLVEDIAPKNIMIYVIDRQTPCPTLQKTDPATMNRIAEAVRSMGFSISVSC